jgi:GPH family glycoside/pentoside/hexuronide:cation symporter
MLATFFATLRIPLMEARSAPLSLAGQVRVVSRNQPFMVLAGVFLLLSLAQATGYSVLPFLFHYVVQNDALLLPFIGILGVMTVISAPLWASLSRRIGKVRGFALSVIGWAVLSCTCLWAGSGGEMRDALVLLRGFLIGLINPGSLVLGLSMLADCIDHERKTTGENREGVFAGVWSALEKLAFAGGPFISGAVLSVLGFVESTSGPAEQTDHALTGIYVSLAWIPVAAAALVLLLLRRYRLYSEP